MPMAPNCARVLMLFLQAFVWTLLISFNSCMASQSDIYCLKSIKDSLEDPYKYLNSSWNFNNFTEGFICKFTGVECWHPDENRVLNIKLSDTGLKGQFPLGIENCTSLTGLDLSSNKLWGPLPPDIGRLLPSVTTLDLSSNNFSGEIPSDIANCSYLNVLKLDHNRLTGHIPHQLGDFNRIKVFSVANNLLSGTVPNFVNATFLAESYANNTGLCGKPLDPCQVKKHDDSFRNGFVAGYIVFVISVIATFMSYYRPWVNTKKKNNMKMESMMWKLITRKKKRNDADRVGKLPNMELLLQEGSKEVSSLEKLVTRMSFTDLSNATNNFNQADVIGLGHMGTMYKAMLPNGFFLAVKKLSNSQQFEEYLISELKTLGRIRHDNLVPLIGFCIESCERLLVYKFMSNGNLYDWLHPKEGEARIMEWHLRVKVAIGLARVLAWLHHRCYFRIAHLNICSRCILLDQNFEPKLSNFGEAMLLNPDSYTSFSVNTEFMESDFVKEDVYSFGVVLLELITGEDPSKMTNASDNDQNEWVTRILAYSSGFYELIDKSLIGQGFDGEIFQFLRVACDCVQLLPDKRPTMLKVYKTIKVVWERYRITDDSENLIQDEIIEIP